MCIKIFSENTKEKEKFMKNKTFEELFVNVNKKLYKNLNLFMYKIVHR